MYRKVVVSLLFLINWIGAHNTGTFHHFNDCNETVKNKIISLKSEYQEVCNDKYPVGYVVEIIIYRDLMGNYQLILYKKGDHRQRTKSLVHLADCLRNANPLQSADLLNFFVDRDHLDPEILLIFGEQLDIHQPQVSGKILKIVKNVPKDTENFKT